jgi:hypothetical protein
VCWLQVIAVFAIGEPLFFPPTPIENEAAP